jgi:hypothetical protein
MSISSSRASTLRLKKPRPARRVLVTLADVAVAVVRVGPSPVEHRVGSSEWQASLPLKAAAHA